MNINRRLAALAALVSVLAITVGQAAPAQEIHPSAANGVGVVVRVATSTPSASISAGSAEMSVTLEGASSVRSQVVGSRRTYAGVVQASDASVETMDNSVQMLTVMHSPLAPSVQRYRLGLPAGTQLAAASGGFLLVEPDGKIHGAIDQPWAKDATGRSLPTSYGLDGTVLVQRTDTTAAVYPVVADPKITFGRSVYLNMWGLELRAAAVAIEAMGGLAIVVGCATLDKIPYQILRMIAVLACGAVGLNLTSLFRAIYRTATEDWIDDYACFQGNLAKQAEPMYRVRPSNCST